MRHTKVQLIDKISDFEEHIEELEKQVYIIGVAQLNVLFNLMCSVSHRFFVQAVEKDKATQKMVSKIAAKDKAISIMLDKAQGQTKAIKNLMETCVGAHDGAHPQGVYV